MATATAKKASEFGLLVARRPFVTIVRGKSLTVQVGDLYRDDDKIVQRNPDAFMEPRVRESGA